MNHSFEVNSLSNSNSDHSHQSSGSRRLGSLVGMNSREHSQQDSDHDDGTGAEGTGKNDKATMVPLHKDFKPGDDDVICGRGKKCYAHTGNERFRQIVQSHLEQYSAASSRPEKSEILSSIVAQVRKNSPSGGFVKQDSKGAWFEVGDFLAREKTSQAFRDALHESYRSSKKSKHEKRRQRTQAKAMSEKLASKGEAAIDQGVDPQAFYASPLISRQRLTVLREEVSPPHPRAFSFSGLTHEPMARSEMRSRALSLSSGRGGGRLGDMLDLGLTSEPYDMPQLRAYQGSEAVHDLGFAQRYPSDDLAAETGDPRLQERLEVAGHESWPQPQRSSSRSLFNPPVAPSFHPVGIEDVAAHRMHPGMAHRAMLHDDKDAIMSEIDNVRIRRPGRLPLWDADMEGDDVPPRRQRRRHGSPSGRSSFAAPTPMGAFSSTPNAAPSDPSVERFATGASAPVAAQASQEAAAIHKRTDSSSASVIVAQLTNALQPESLAVDDNPFEPIPLPGRSKKKAKIDKSDRRSKW